MENLCNLYGIFGQNNGQNCANENVNHLPEFLHSANNGSSSLSKLNFQSEEDGPNFSLDFSSILSLEHFQVELRQPLQDITQEQNNNSSSNQTAMRLVVTR